MHIDLPEGDGDAKYQNAHRLFEQWKADGEKRERVTWFPVVVFNGLAETCANYIDRGRLLAIQGRVQTREYEDREGTRHQVMQVVGEKVTRSVEE